MPLFDELYADEIGEEMGRQAEARVYNLPPLRGSEKQVAWAEQVRSRKLAECRKVMLEWKGYRERMEPTWPDEKRQREHEAYWNAAATLNVIEQEDRSWWWLDRKDFTGRELLAGKEPEPDPTYGRRS